MKHIHAMSRDVPAPAQTVLANWKAILTGFGNEFVNLLFQFPYGTLDPSDVLPDDVLEDLSPSNDLNQIL